MVKTKRAFTLIELIIVIAIIAVLGTAAFLVLTEWLGKSRDSRRVQDMNAITTAINTFILQENSPSLPTGANWSGVYLSADEKIDVLSYQGPFDKDYFNLLQGEGFDTFQKIVRDPKGMPYVLAVDTITYRDFNVAATKEFTADAQAYNAIMNGSFFDKTIQWSGSTENGQVEVPSLLVDGRYQDTDYANYSITGSGDSSSTPVDVNTLSGSFINETNYLTSLPYSLTE